MTQVDFYDKGQIDAKEIGTPTDEASASGSLWARIKNAIARIVSLETADSNNVKKTGTSTVTGTLEVPTTPPTTTSAVNSVYVNDATEGINNIVHKSGNESISGSKSFNSTINARTTIDATVTPDTYQVVSIPLRVGDKNNLTIFEQRYYANANGGLGQNLSITNRMHENNRADTAILTFSLDNNGYITFGGEKTVNGVRTFFTIWTDRT